MGGGFNPLEKRVWYHAIEDTSHWEKFCYKQIAESRKELKQMDKRRGYVHTWRHSTTFPDAVKTIKQLHQAIRKEKNEELDRVHKDYFNVFTANSKLEQEARALRATLDMKEELMGTRQTHNQQIDAFLSKRIAERYQELNNLFRKATDNKVFIFTCKTHLKYHCGRYNNDERLRKKITISPELWGLICENWRPSSGSASESKSDTKKSEDSARPTHVNECGI
jgi:hypothetical protein